VGCSVRANRHGYLAFRLYFDGLESHEGTKLRDTPQNREKVAARARVIAQEIRDGTFEYLRWFPAGNLASRFEPTSMPAMSGRSSTVRGFFREWTSAESRSRPVSPKWSLNRASYIRNHVIPSLGRIRLDQLTPSHLTDLQTYLRRRRLAPSTIDRVIHSALRGMLRDADLAGYRVTDLATLFDRRFVEHLDRGRHAAEIDPFTEEEREQILAWFLEERPLFHTFVFFRFWTGTRPSEAIGLRWRDIDLPSRRVKIRRSRVYGTDGQTKTGKSKRDVLLPGKLERILRTHRPRRPAPDDFVFTMPSGAPITEVNFYRREWLPALKVLKIRARPFYNTRHSYITTLLEAGAKPLFICRQTGTSLAMIEKHYGASRTDASELDRLLSNAAERPGEEAAANRPPSIAGEPDIRARAAVNHRSM
jgi:integrase